MSLWVFFLVILGAFEAYGKCPLILDVFPCTCSVISDKYGDDFAILTCRQIQSEDVLMQILDSTRGERLFEFQLVDSSLRFIPYKAFLDTYFEVSILYIRIPEFFKFSKKGKSPNMRNFILS